jgi:hypothetical protein
MRSSEGAIADPETGRADPASPPPAVSGPDNTTTTPTTYAASSSSSTCIATIAETPRSMEISSVFSSEPEERGERKRPEEHQQKLLHSSLPGDSPAEYIDARIPPPYSQTPDDDLLTVRAGYSDGVAGGPANDNHNTHNNLNISQESARTPSPDSIAIAPTPASNAPARARGKARQKVPEKVSEKVSEKVPEKVPEKVRKDVAGWGSVRAAKKQKREEDEPAAGLCLNAGSLDDGNANSTLSAAGAIGASAARASPTHAGARALSPHFLYTHADTFVYIYIYIYIQFIFKTNEDEDTDNQRHQRMVARPLLGLLRF